MSRVLVSAGVVSTVVPDSPHKLFIGGLPNYLNDDQVLIRRLGWRASRFFAVLSLSVCLTNSDGSRQHSHTGRKFVP